MRTHPSHEQCWRELRRVTAAAASRGQPAAIFEASHKALDSLIAAKLFTILRVLPDGSTERMYTTDPAAYPPSGRKPRNETPWYERVILARRHYFGSTKARIREVLFDHELIFSLGCGSVINVLVVYDGRVLGTVNMLHEEHWYRPKDPARAEQIVAMLILALL
jgi:(2Fe-2S) ferredoxin